MEMKDILKAMRKEARMSQSYFCGYFGIPRRTLEDWERGIKHMPDYLLRLMVYKLETEHIIQHHEDWATYTRRRYEFRKKGSEGTAE